MDSRKFQALVDEVLGVLGKIVNLKAFPFLPVIYSSIFYFVKRGEAYRNAVRAIPVGPRSRIVINKSKRFVDDFLAQHAPSVLAGSDARGRRRAFSSLYPVLGLRDPFLLALFRDEVDSGDLQIVVDSFDTRVHEALAEIPAPRSDPAFWRALDAFVRASAGLALNLAREREIQDLIIKRVNQYLKERKK
ncbi:MAG: hypothetical protein AB1714_04985 [Acidobacteriota bacterium]